MNIPIVMDTNVLVTAFKSKKGASYKLVSLIGKDKFQLNISVPLILEYEDALKKKIRNPWISNKDIDAVLDYICSVAKHFKVFFLWRPVLKDPRDDMVLELAVSSQSKYIITYNLKHFQRTDRFGIKAITPKELLIITGELS